MWFSSTAAESHSLLRSHPSKSHAVKLKDGHTQHIFWSQSFEQFGIRSCQDRSGKPKTFQLAKGWATFYAYIHSLQCRWCSWCNGGLPSSLRYSQVRLTLKSFVTFPDTVKSHGTTHRLEPYRHLVGKQSEDPRDTSKKTETSTLREFFGMIITKARSEGSQLKFSFINISIDWGRFILSDFSRLSIRNWSKLTKGGSRQGGPPPPP